MMRTIYLICFITLANVLLLQAQKQAEVKQDAIQLAARLLEHNQVVEEIPNVLIDSIFNILNNIAKSSLKESVIIDEFDMQAYPKVDVYSINFLADAAADWVKAFLANPQYIPAPLDYLAYSYEGISLELIQASPIYCEFKLHSTVPMNMANFARQISNLPDIDMVMLGGNDKRANTNQKTDIKLERIDGAWVVSYYYKANKSSEYYWQFSLEDNGTVNFIGEYGDTPPPNYKSSETL